MKPYLVDRADGVPGHFAIGRENPPGYAEYWSKKNKRWASCADYEPLTKKQAKKLLASALLCQSAEGGDKA